MYTTTILEGLNRQYRKVTKTKRVFPSDTALENYKNTLKSTAKFYISNSYRKFSFFIDTRFFTPSIL